MCLSRRMTKESARFRTLDAVLRKMEKSDIRVDEGVKNIALTVTLTGGLSHALHGPHRQHRHRITCSVGFGTSVAVLIF
jgi:hypothetical protein